MLRENLSKNLSLRMQHLGVKSARDLESKSGVSKSLIGIILKDSHNTSLDMADSLANALNVPAWLLLSPPEIHATIPVNEAPEILRKLAMLKDKDREVILSLIDSLFLAQN